MQIYVSDDFAICVQIFNKYDVPYTRVQILLILIGDSVTW